MEFVISSESMRLSDESTIKNGVSAIDLMERVAQSLYSLIKDKKDSKIAIVCGSGNNGGDGYALACVLLRKDFNVTIFGKLPKTESAKYFYNIVCSSYGENFNEISSLRNLSAYDITIDCLLGIGIKGALSDEYVKYIKIINNSKYIISCDIPSGLDSDSGKKSPVAVNADVTLAIQSYKTGHFFADGKDKTGKLVLADIGIDIVGEKYYIVDSTYAKKAFPDRKNNSHKGDYGRCGIVACPDNFVGAGVLAQASATSMMGECAMRTGSGYSYLFVPDKMIPYMWKDTIHSCIFGHSEISSHKLDAIAFGMGVGDNAKLCRAVLDYPCVKVVDADALNFLAKNKSYLSKVKGCVLTPHLMEFSRLINVKRDEILENPIKYAVSFAKDNEVILLLKGVTTIVTDGEKVYLNTGGNSGLAKGGSGDVLSGIIASLLAQKISPFDAAIISSFIASKTAEITLAGMSKQSMLPYDIAQRVGDIVGKIAKGKI